MIHSEMYTKFHIPDKVAMIDIDGTLIDDKYKVTDDQLMDTVSSAQENGWRIGLSSDTPHSTMKRWAARFGMNGPIIAEKGAFTSYKEFRASTAAHTYDFRKLRNAFLDDVSETGAIVVRGEPVQILQSGEQIGDPGETVVLINDFREYSVGYFTRAVGEDGNLKIDNDSTDEFANIIRSHYPDDLNFDEDLNHQHGLMIISHEGMNKRVGTIEMTKMIDVGRIAMIGNSIADYVGNDIALHLAVGNANPDFKEVADYVANDPVTSGVIEAISMLVRINKYAVEERVI